MQDSRIPWLGSVPSHWKRGKLKQYIFEISEKNSPVKTTDILSLTNKLGVVPYEEKGNQGNTAKEKYDEYKLAYPDTIVANSMNILIGSVGYCAYFGCVSPVYYVFKNLKNGNLKYINYIFQTTEFQKCLRQFSNGILEIRQRVSAKTILNQDFFFPTLDEQNKIVEYLDTKCAQIDTIIAKEQFVIEKLQEYNRAIISEAVTKGINSDREVIDSGVQWIGRIPNSWKIIKLKYEADIRRGRFSHRPRNDPDYYDGKYPFIQTGDITASKKYITSYTQTLNERGLNVSTSFPKDTICMSIAANIGDVAILSFDACFPDSIVGISSKKIEINYLYYALKNMKERLLSVATISTQQNINVEILNDEFIALPPVNEQKQISNYLDRKSEAIDRIVYQKKYLIDKLNEYKKSLIYEVVTGKKEVPHV